MIGSDLVILLSLFLGFSVTTTFGYILGAALTAARIADEQADHDNVIYFPWEGDAT